MRKDTAPAHTTFGAAATAAVLILGAWCGPALGASNVTIAGDDSDAVLDTTTIAAPPLAAHSDSALADTLDDEAVETPAFITRLPGVSDAVLPSFRRQMHRTDI